jgi:hypothetical protein
MASEEISAGAVQKEKQFPRFARDAGLENDKTSAKEPV